MTENTTVKETVKDGKKESVTIIKPGFYANNRDSVVRLVPKETQAGEDHKVKVIIFDENKITADLADEIAKDRGWEEPQWKKLSEKIEHKTELIQRKLTENINNPIQFEGWEFISKKFFPLKKCVKTEKYFRATDANQIVCPEYKDKLLNELKSELADMLKKVDEPECNINTLWRDLTNYKNKVVGLNTENQLSVRPYRTIRKEIQDVYNKAALKRDVIKKEWEGKKAEKKKHLSEIIEEAKKINEVSQAAAEFSPEALTMLKNIRQKAKDLEAQGLIPPWGVKKLYSEIAPISKHEDEKKQKSLEAKRESINKWRNNANSISDKISAVDLLNETYKKQLLEISDTITKSKESGDIGDREQQRLIGQIEDKLKQANLAKEKEASIAKHKEKLIKKLEATSLKEIRSQCDKVNIGFAYSPEVHDLLRELLKATDKVESKNEAKKEDIDSVRKQVNEKIKTVESLKALYRR